MTNKEAIDITKDFCEGCDVSAYVDDMEKKKYCDVCWAREYNETVIKALEKQIPKKPNIVINKIKYYNCGSCGSNVRFEDEYRYLHNCGICGQAIDWSEVDK